MIVHYNIIYIYEYKRYKYGYAKEIIFSTERKTETGKNHDRPGQARTDGNDRQTDGKTDGNGKTKSPCYNAHNHKGITLDGVG